MISRWEGRERGRRGTAGEMEEIKQRQERGGEMQNRSVDTGQHVKRKIKDENGRAETWRNKGSRRADADRGEDDKVFT